MSQWVSINEDGFIVADVIRWRDTVYARRGSKKSKPRIIGHQLIVAEVIGKIEADRKTWVQLLVRQCETLDELTIKKLVPIALGSEIKRALNTVMRAKPERLSWSDEDARACVIAR